MARDLVLEICVDSLGLALAAARGGADRIELCGPLYGGGITPSAGLAAAARAKIDLPLAMLIRARPGPFTASAAEFEVMQQDVIYARDLGMDIVVLGLLQHDRRVDVARTSQLVALAGPMQVTFHRAFDAAVDQEKALEDVIETGAMRVLTSGAASNALAGAPGVARLREQAADRLSMLLCGSIGAANVTQAVAISGVREVHAALRSSVALELLNGGASPQDLDYFANSVAKLKQRMQDEADPTLMRSELATERDR